VLLVVAVYADPIFLRRNFAGRDLTNYNYPVEKSIHDAYSRRRLPVWMSEVSGGRPLLPNPNIAALYPVRPLLSLLPFPLAMRVFPLLHWAGAAIGMFVLLTSIGSSRGAAWVGAVTYVFSGVAISEVYLPHLPGLALLPWIVWAAARPAPSPCRRILPLSLLFALMFLAGDVFAAGLALLASVLWIALEKPRSERTREAIRLGASILLGSLLAAPQILATLLWSAETNRAVLGMRLGEVFYFSVSPFRLLEFLIPFPFGATWEIDPARVWGTSVFGGKVMGLFTSLYAGAFVSIALVKGWRERSLGARFARVLFFLTLGAAALPSLMPASWARLSSPLPLRNPEKLVIGSVFALAILTALAFDWSARWTRARRSLIAIGGLFLLLAVAAHLRPQAFGRAAVRLVGSEPRLAKTAAEQLPAALALGGLLWMATLLALEARQGGTQTGVLLSILLLTAVPIAANRRIAKTFREEEVFAPPAFTRLLARADPGGEYRTLGESLYRPVSRLQTAQHGSDVAYLQFSRRNWNQYTHTLWGRGTVFNEDLDAGDLSRVESLRRFSWAAAHYTDTSAFFGSLALRWGIRFRDQAPLAGYRRVGGDALQDWDEHEGALPDIRLLTVWREETGALSALAAIPRLAPGEIVLETGSRGRGAAAPGRLRVLEKSPERLILETETSNPTWLFVLRGYWKHRTIRLDGRKVEDVPAQIAFSALAVPSGRHRIDWKERVPGGEVSCWGPVLFALTAILLLLRGRRDAAPIGRRS